jgi:hypothetical protein
VRTAGLPESELGRELVECQAEFSSPKSFDDALPDETRGV